MLLIEDDEETVDKELDEGLCCKGVVTGAAGDAVEVDATGPSEENFKKSISPCFKPTSTKCWERLEVSWKRKER